MVLTTDGGTWAQHTAQVCASQLKEMESSVGEIKEKQSELVQKLKEECFSQNESLLATLVDSIPHHLEDVAFLEATSRQQEECKRCASDACVRGRVSVSKISIGSVDLSWDMQAD